MGKWVNFAGGGKYHGEDLLPTGFLVQYLKVGKWYRIKFIKASDKAFPLV